MTSLSDPHPCLSARRHCRAFTQSEILGIKAFQRTHVFAQAGFTPLSAICSQAEDSDDSDPGLALDLPDQTLSDPQAVSRFREICQDQSESPLFTRPRRPKEVCEELPHLLRQFQALRPLSKQRAKPAGHIPYPDFFASAPRSLVGTARGGSCRQGI